MGPENKQTQAVTASPPIFLLGEDPSAEVFLGGAIILFGIAMILFEKKNKKK